MVRKRSAEILAEKLDNPDTLKSFQDNPQEKEKIVQSAIKEEVKITERVLIIGIYFLGIAILMSFTFGGLGMLGGVSNEMPDFMAVGTGAAIGGLAGLLTANSGDS